MAMMFTGYKAVENLKEGDWLEVDHDTKRVKKWQPLTGIEREVSRLKWAWGGNELWVCSGAKTPNGCAFPQDCTHGRPHAFIEGKCEDEADWRKPNWGSACKVAKCSLVYGTVVRPAPSPRRRARIWHYMADGPRWDEQVEIQMEGE
jgi:hypothetical protein